ncbi:MAG: hypothetical protein WBG50_28110 [Desulfomonilaceae bacterium]
MGLSTRDLDLGFAHEPQIDMYCNLNTHVIEDYYGPIVRFAGRGGPMTLEPGASVPW